VSYLNTVPLVWGMLHGLQRGVFDLTFEVPSVCAAKVRDGQADIGIVPVATLLDQKLEIFRGTGIACHGPVRTILLISKKPFANVEVLAVDSGSRTSVMLSRIILREIHGAEPALISMQPQLRPMLEAADAALIIGDAALLLDPAELRERGLYVADLGADWTRMTGLPMVFAVWAGVKEVHTSANEAAFVESLQFGLQHIDDIVAGEHEMRGVSARLARQYLTEHIVFELGDTEYRGMEAFLQAAAALPAAQYLQPAVVASEKMVL
jgi:chorismate dehydratase